MHDRMAQLGLVELAPLVHAEQAGERATSALDGGKGGDGCVHDGGLVGDRILQHRRQLYLELLRPLHRSVPPPPSALAPVTHIHNSSLRYQGQTQRHACRTCLSRDSKMKWPAILACCCFQYAIPKLNVTHRTNTGLYKDDNCCNQPQQRRSVAAAAQTSRSERNLIFFEFAMVLGHEIDLHVCAWWRMQTFRQLPGTPCQAHTSQSPQSTYVRGDYAVSGTLLCLQYQSRPRASHWSHTPL